MNVGTLKQIIADYPDDMAIILASDEEGNEFHWLYQHGESYVKENTVHLETVYGEEDLQEIREEAEEYGDEAPEFIKVLVLWP